jgi:hypothetical protein
VRVPLVLVMVVGGIAHADSVRERLASLPVPLVAVTGHVYDLADGTPLEGVTVLAPTNQVAITDARGAFSLDVPRALTVVELFYADASYERTIFPREGMALETRIAKPPPAPPACPGEVALAPSPADVDGLVAAVVAHARQLADGALLPASFSVVAPGARGVRGATRRSARDIQALADSTQREQTYLVIDDEPQVSGDCAVVSASVQKALPRGDRRTLLCCCSSTDVYRRRRDGTWVFDRNLGAACA